MNSFAKWEEMLFIGIKNLTMGLLSYIPTYVFNSAIKKGSINANLSTIQLQKNSIS